MNLIFEPLILSLYISFITTIILLIICMPVAWWLSKNNNILKKIIEIFIMLPLVLPPTVIGFYLLLLFNSDSFIGILWYNLFGSTLIFSVSGLIVASLIYSLPFCIQPLQVAFKKIDYSIIEHAYILKYSNIKIFFKIILPLSKNAILISIILTFAHTLGEFGVVLMIGGNIPGKTQMISIAIYESVEMLNYQLTHKLSFLILLISFFILIFLYSINKNEN